MQPIPYFGEKFEGKWIVEPKIDGWRLQIIRYPDGKLELWGRRLEKNPNWTDKLQNIARLAEKITIPSLKEKFEPKLREQITRTFKPSTLGDEMAYSVEIKGVKYFLIGDKVQTPEDFAKQIESRFEGKFEKAWQEAVEHCRKYDEGILKSQRYFYEMVYKPYRDQLAQQWTAFSKR